MSTEKVMRILKRKGAEFRGEVEVFELNPGIIGVTVKGMDERERGFCLASLQLEAMEWGYKLLEVVEP